MVIGYGRCNLHLPQLSKGIFEKGEYMYCLKCGKKIEKGTFCPECQKLIGNIQIPELKMVKSENDQEVDTAVPTPKTVEGETIVMEKKAQFVASRTGIKEATKKHTLADGRGRCC